MSRRARGCFVLGVVVPLLSAPLLGGACGETKGGLMLAVTTDMKAPKDVNAVSIAISVNGAVKHSFIGRVTPQGEVALPATLAIAESDDPNATVRVRVIAFQDRRPRVLRDVRTTIPRNGRIATLPIRLAFVNLDKSTKSAPAPEGVVPAPLPGTGGPDAGAPAGGSNGAPPADFDFFAAFAPDCPDIENQTFIDGECRDSYVDSASLPDFDPASLAATSTDPTTCFDVARCLANATRVDLLDATSCSVPLGGADPARINFAFVTPDAGECINAGECYVPIDRGPSGWTVKEGRAQFPPFVCRLVGSAVRLHQTIGTCDAKQESSPICAAKPGDLAPPQVSIGGTMIDVYHPGDTAPTITRPRDLTVDTTLELLVARADGELSPPKPIAGRADGTFAITFQPEAAGPAYVHVRKGTEDFYVVTPQGKTLTLGADYQGRPDVQTGAAEGTKVRLSLDGLSPTTPGERFDVTSVGAAANMQSIIELEGATSADVDFTRTGGNLIDGSKGDVAFALQARTTDAGQYEVVAVTRFAALPPFTEVSGATTQVPASGRVTMRAFTQAETASARVEWKRSQFQALRTDIHPQAVAGEQLTGVYAEPFGGLTYGVSYAELAVLRSGPEAADIASAPIAHGNPFPASWGPLVFARSQFAVSVTAPGAKATQLLAPIEAYAPVPASGVIDARPYVGPPRNIRIDGVSASETSSVAASPRVEWDAPAVGTANMYVIEVVRLDNTAGETSTTTVTSIYSAERSARIPAGVLQPGATYLLRLFSMADGRVDPALAPNHFSIPFGRARAYTNPFSRKAS